MKLVRNKKTIFVIILIVSMASYLQFRPHPDSAFELQEIYCWFLIKQQLPNTSCFYMVLPENYQYPKGPLVKIPVVKIQSTSKSKKNPVLHLGGGGPGSSLGLDNVVDPLFSRLLSILFSNNQSEHLLLSIYRNMSVEIGRDLYLMDPRGAGLAKPKIVCHEFIDLTLSTINKNISSREDVDKSLESYRQCYERLVAEGKDLGQYNSVTIAKDVEELRKAFKINKWNLYGVSYASRYALTYARDFSHGIESMVLDGTVFSNVRYDDRFVRDYLNAFELGLQYCRTSELCKTTPNLQPRFWRVVEKLQKNPLMLEIKISKHRPPIKFLLNDERLINVVYHALYDIDFLPELPQLVIELEQGKTKRILQQAQNLLELLLDTSYGDASANSHFCYEERPFADYSKARKLLNETGANLKTHLASLISFSEKICQVWKVPVAAAIEGKPIKTDVPVLFLHGALDPVLPVSELEQQMKYFPNHAYLIFEDVAHDVIGSSKCAENAAGKFFEYGLEYSKHVPCLE